MTSQISVEVVHDPFSRSVHTTSSVGRFVGRNHSPRQLVIASPGTPLLEILDAKDSDEKRHENFSKNLHERCTCFIEYAETNYLRSITENLMLVSRHLLVWEIVPCIYMIRCFSLL